VTATTAEGRWAAAYEALRAREGRGAAADPERLPYVSDGPLAAQWAIRARTYERFLGAVFTPLARKRAPLRLLDLGAGNGWLCHRTALLGCAPVAVDVRVDAVDGLSAARGARFPRLAGSFEALPLRSRRFDVVLFNASLHYAVDLGRALAEAARLACPGGTVAILDSPFYEREEVGAAMVEERDAATRRAFPDLADALEGIRRAEFLTRERLARAASPHGLSFARKRVLYPLTYELRPWRALLKGARPPSRFDLWTAVVA
jgi:SAM-dependent methyltransferase